LGDVILAANVTLEYTDAARQIHHPFPARRSSRQYGPRWHVRNGAPSETLLTASTRRDVTFGLDFRANELLEDHHQGAVMPEVGISAILFH